MMRRALLVLALLAGFLSACFLPAAARAADLAAGLVPGGAGMVTEVVDGDTVVLEGGSQVRLVGIQAPKLPLGRPGFTAWPFAEQSRAALLKMAGDRHVRLLHGGRERDRHGRALAHLHLDDGTWVQGELLRGGFARVYSFPDNRALVAEMLALEREARAARRGMWRFEAYRVRSADEPLPEDTFHLVEGTVAAADRVGRRVYLNFGADWRSDFTAVIEARDLRAFRSAMFDPIELEGRRIRVRGWVYTYNGPAIDVTHPEQIEVLD
ncbi:MAG TPA: thermonuclease family protein [Arenibaculum sp.]|nr:thermonuclease family protein [Arenibaculum sp.]